MNDSPDVSAEQFLRLEPVCEKFEADCSRASSESTDPPEIESYLTEVESEDRDALREELESIRQAGLAPADRSVDEDEPVQEDSRNARTVLVQADDTETDTGTADASRIAAQDIPGYEILGELGHGGMGVVYRARDTRLDRIVALKMILAGPHADATRISRFQREATFLAQLRHPHIVQIHEVGEHRGQPYITLEYVEGGTLEDLAENEPLAARDAAQLVQSLARAIHVTHQLNILHRDLKPANVLLTPEGEPKITDFGLAKQLQGQGTQTQTGAILGSPGYMAPEQAGSGLAEVGPATDVYALGSILYFLVTRRAPFESESLFESVRQILEDSPVSPRRLDNATSIDRDLDTVILKCLEKDPARRYESAEALADELGRYLAGEPILARPVSTSERAWRWCKRNPVVAGLSSAVVLVLTVGTIVSTVLASEFYAQKGIADSRKADALANLVLAQKNEVRAQRQVYLSDLRLAQREWDGANLGSVRSLLDKHEEDQGLIGFEWHYWNSLLDSDLMTLSGHQDNLTSVAYHPDGKWLASSSVDGTVGVWDAESGARLHTLEGHKEGVHCVVFSPDGKQLASCGKDWTIKLWNPESGELIRTLVGHRAGVHGLSYHADGRQLASCSSDHSAIVWDVETGQVVISLRGHKGTVTEVVFSPDGKLLATSGDDNSVKLWDAETGQVDHTFHGQDVEGLIVYFSSVVFSPDGSRLAAASRDHDVKLWDVRTRKELRVCQGHTDLVSCVAFSPDGERLVSCGGDGTIRVWETASARQLLILRAHSGGAIQTVTFSPDGERLASVGGDDKNITVWDAIHGQEPLILSSPLRAIPSPNEIISSVRGVALSPDGTRLAAATWGTSVKLVDLLTGKTVLRLKGNKGLVTHVVFSLDGTRLAAIGRTKLTNSITVWDTATGESLVSKEEPVQNPGGFYVPRISLSPDGKRVAAAGSGHSVKEWDIQSEDLLQTFKGHTNSVEGVAYSSDGKLLASGSWDHRIIVWDTATGTPVHSLESGDRFIRDVAFSPDGTRLASCGAESAVKLWDVQSGKCVRKLIGHIDNVLCVAISPDGKRLASAGSDATVRIWDLQTGSRILTLEGHTAEIDGISFSADSRRLATASIDQTVRVWGGDMPARSLTVELGKSEEAHVHLGRGAMHSRLGGKISQSLESFQAAIDIYQALIDEGPDDPERRNDLANAYHELGLAQGGFAGDRNSQVTLGDAIGSLRMSIDIRQKLVADHPQDAKYRNALAGTFNLLAIIQENARKQPDAVVSYHRAIQGFERLVQEHPDIPYYASNLSQAYFNLADLQEKSRQPSQALDSFRQAILIGKRLVAEYPKTAMCEVNLALAYLRLGRLHGGQSDHVESLAAFRQAVEIYRRLVKADPDKLDYRSGLAQSLYGLGVVQQRVGSSEDALKTLREVIDHYEQLVADRPLTPAFSIRLARAHVNLGHGLRDADRLTEALEHFSTTVLLLKRVLPNVQQRNRQPVSEYLRNAYLRRATCLTSLKRFQEAIDDWDRLIDLLPQSLEQLRTRYGLRRSLTRALAGRHSEAVAEMETLMKSQGTSAVDRYNIVCVFAIAVRTASADGDLPEADRKTLSEKYAVRAVKLLAALRDRSFFNDPKTRQLLEGDADLDSLRLRADFQEVLKSVIRLPMSRDPGAGIETHSAGIGPAMVGS